MFAIAKAGAAFIAAAALTAFFWMPTVALLPRIPRTPLMRSLQTNPANHALGPEWLYLLIAPNLLGTPQSNSWIGPDTHHPAVLEDYGEIASGYAGLITLAFALSAIATVRRKEVWFFAGLMLFAFLTIAEVPLWRDLLRYIPVVGITLHQRLRVMWALGAAVCAAFAFEDEKARARGPIVAAALAGLVALIYVSRAARVSPVGWITLGVSLGTVALMIIARRVGWMPAALVFVELYVVTFQYNPSAASDDALRRTAVVDALARSRKPSRFAALGWSFLPDTPGFYGIEDVKTTDPISNPRYTRMMRGFLHVVPSSYDEIIGSTEEPFFDFLNIEHVYVPPDVFLPDGHFRVAYRGADGALLANTRALPRYFLVERYTVDQSYDRAIPKIKEIRDFTHDAVVDHVPSKTSSFAPQLQPKTEGEWMPSAGGDVRIVSYRNNSCELDVNARGWSLLASSDNHWPGWKAYVNDERQPPVTINNAFLGVFVPPGRSRVLFRYDPPEFQHGLRISGATALLLVVLWAVAAIRKRKSRHPEPAQSREAGRSAAKDLKMR